MYISFQCYGEPDYCLETGLFYELHLVPKCACIICDLRFPVRKYLGTGAKSLFEVVLKGANTI